MSTCINSDSDESEIFSYLPISMPDTLESSSVVLKAKDEELTVFKEKKAKEDHNNEQRQMLVDMLRVHDEQKKINCEIM